MVVSIVYKVQIIWRSSAETKSSSAGPLEFIVEVHFRSWEVTLPRNLTESTVTTALPSMVMGWSKGGGGLLLSPRWRAGSAPGGSDHTSCSSPRLDAHTRSLKCSGEGEECYTSLGGTNADSPVLDVIPPPSQLHLLPPPCRGGWCH